MPPFPSAWRPVATSRSTRARRFALPDHGNDERTHEAIEAFLEGPEVRRHRPTLRRPRRKGYPNTGSDPAKANQPADGEAASADAMTDVATKPGAPDAGAETKPGVIETPVANGTSAANANAGAPPRPAAASRNGTRPATWSAMVPSTETRPATVVARSVTDIRTIPGPLQFP